MSNTKDWGLLAELLLDAAGDRVAALGHPVWVKVLDPPDDGEDTAAERFTLVVSDAENALMGWLAAPDCQAVGMIGSGRMRPVPGAPEGFTAISTDGVRMVCLVTRDDEVYWRMARADGSPMQVAMPDGPPSEGRLLDCLRRCFGLPTSPPPASPARLQLIAWLGAALQRAEQSRRPLSWSELARIHPLACVLADAPASEISQITDTLTRMGAAAYSWEDYRVQAASEDGILDEIINPDLARWMDDGMFARWVLSDLPTVDELFAALRPRLTASATRRMAHAVHAAGATHSTIVS